MADSKTPGSPPSGDKPAPKSGDSAYTQWYEVKKGDTLWKIASRYRVTVGELCELNDLSVGAPLVPGMRLTVAR